MFTRRVALGQVRQIPIKHEANIDNVFRRGAVQVGSVYGTICASRAIFDVRTRGFLTRSNH